MVVFVFVEVRRYSQRKKLKKTRLEIVEIWMRCDMNLNFRYFYDWIIFEFKIFVIDVSLAE